VKNVNPETMACSAEGQPQRSGGFTFPVTGVYMDSARGWNLCSGLSMVHFLLLLGMTDQLPSRIYSQTHILNAAFIKEFAPPCKRVSCE
jgi:hypothetical protein